VFTILNHHIPILPVKFRKVTGYFDCLCNGLNTLEGCPDEVGEWFRCSANPIETLDHFPKKIGGDLYFSNCSVEATDEELRKISEIDGRILRNC